MVVVVVVVVVAAVVVAVTMIDIMCNFCVFVVVRSLLPRFSLFDKLVTCSL